MCLAIDTEDNLTPKSPLQMERGFKTTRKTGFLPLLQYGEGGRGDEVQKLARGSKPLATGNKKIKQQPVGRRNRLPKKSTSSKTIYQTNEQQKAVWRI